MKKTIYLISIILTAISVQTSAFAEIPSVTLEGVLDSAKPLYSSEITNGLNVDIVNATVKGGSTLHLTNTNSSGDINISFKNSTIGWFALSAGTNRVHTGNLNVTIDGGTIAQFNTAQGSTINGNVNLTVNGGNIEAIIDAFYANITGNYNVTINATDSNNPVNIAAIACMTSAGMSHVTTMNYTFTGNSENLSIGAIGLAENASFTFGDKNNTFNGTFDASICQIPEPGSDGKNYLPATLNNVVVANGNMSFNNLDVETLTVVASENNKVELLEGSKVKNIVVEISDEMMESETFDVGVVLSGISDENLDKISLQNASGELYTGTITFTPQVPEPSTYAAIFGAVALGFAIYRRRK